MEIPRFRENWIERSRIIAGMIAPGSAVIDFGAGERKLKDMLPPGCIYVGFDIEDFDLNKTEDWPDLPYYDVAVFSGVFEWLDSVTAVLKKVTAPTLVCSYADFNSSHTIDDRLRNGWKNHFTYGDFYRILQANCYWPAEIKPWEGQFIFRCLRVQELKNRNVIDYD